jgi:hypothetical protein
MGKSNFVWGEPSLAQDIAKNYHKTHHLEYIESEVSIFDRIKFAGGGKTIVIKKEKVFVKNDEKYLNSVNSELIAPSNNVVEFSEHYLNKDNFANQENKFFSNKFEEQDFFDSSSLEDDWEY